MEVIKTTVGRHLLNMFTENIAYSISQFLVEDEEENRVKEAYKSFYEALLKQKGKRFKFLRYCKNLRYDAFGVYSYGLEVIELNWKHKTAKRLGRWSKTTSTHMNYAIHTLALCYDFKEIK